MHFNQIRSGALARLAPPAGDIKRKSSRLISSFFSLRQLGEKISDPLAMYLSDIYTVTANLAGIPAISIPCGFTQSGLPVGLQILSNQFQENTLLRLAESYAKAYPLKIGVGPLLTDLF